MDWRTHLIALRLDWNLLVFLLSLLQTPPWRLGKPCKPMETVTAHVRHPVFFDWLDKVDSNGNTLIGAKTALLKSRRRLAIRITKKIIANGEKVIGHGLTTM
jgi:hypothetical protein